VYIQGYASLLCLPTVYPVYTTLCTPTVPPWVHHPTTLLHAATSPSGPGTEERGPGLNLENSSGNEAHRALPSPKGVRGERVTLRVVTPLLPDK